MAAIGYARVSTGRQAGLGHSLGAQTEAIRRYCQLYGLELTQVLTEAGVSAKTTERPQFQRMMDLVRCGQIDAIVCYKIDRLFRSMKDALNTLDFLKRKRVQFHSVVERWDTSTAMGEFALNIMLAVAQLERAQTAERTSNVLQSMIRARGESVNGRPPYGYWWKNGRLAPRPEEARIRKILFDLRFEGFTDAQCAQIINNRGYRLRNGNRWTASQVHKILKRLDGGRKP